MDICILSENCVRVTVSKRECDYLQISYDDFSPDNVSTRLFIASILAKLQKMGTELKKCDKLTAEIFENTDEDLIIFLSGKNMKASDGSADQKQLYFCTSEELLEYFKQNKVKENIMLYKTSNGYALINKYDNSIAAAKIKEHGELLSDSPAEIIKDLF
ncbi:MAG: hypothetical protein J6M17_06185 [Ruminococcus sp.]|nr:hypothetical protein [Ruminococcus sp.]